MKNNKNGSQLAFSFVVERGRKIILAMDYYDEHSSFQMKLFNGGL